MITRLSTDPAIPEGSPIDSLKEELTSHIQSILNPQKLTQQEAAELAGCNRVRISNILNGSYKGCTLDALFEILVNLNNEITVEIIPPPPPRKIRVVRQNGRNNTST